MDRLSAMVAFVRIVEGGSLSAAARSLDTTQPSISRQLRALERRLDTQLLRRSTRHLSLTEIGQTYYESCKRILSDLDATEASLAALHTGLQGTLRVNTSVALGVDYVAPLACAFQRDNPRLTVDLTLNERFVDPVEEGIDVAVRFGQIRDANLIAHPLGRTRLVTVAAPSYLRRHGTPGSPQDLASHTCVAFNYVPQNEWIYHGPEGEVRVRLTGVFQSNNGHVIREALVAGIGIGWLPEAVMFDALKQGKLKALLPGYSMSSVDVHAVYAGGAHVPAKVRAFVGYLEARFPKLPGFAAVPKKHRATVRGLSPPWS
jgi:DNA-binding transcriptional LysR family regulator